MPVAFLPSKEEVLGGGLEPPRIAPYAPQAHASTNSATRARLGAGSFITPSRLASPFYEIFPNLSRLVGGPFINDVVDEPDHPRTADQISQGHGDEILNQSHPGQTLTRRNGPGHFHEES